MVFLGTTLHIAEDNPQLPITKPSCMPDVLGAPSLRPIEPLIMTSIWHQCAPTCQLGGTMRVLPALKPESCYGANFVVAGGSGWCQNNFRCRQWRQSWHHKNSRVSVSLRLRPTLASRGHWVRDSDWRLAGAARPLESQPNMGWLDAVGTIWSEWMAWSGVNPRPAGWQTVWTLEALNGLWIDSYRLLLPFLAYETMLQLTTTFHLDVRDRGGL